jgi:hypothetical protein
MNWRQLAVAASLLALTVGCGSNTPTSPGLSVQMLQGAWTSSTNNTSPTGCTNLKWTVTNISGNTGSGTFSATCLGSLDVSGTASGTVTGSTLAWSVSGTATPAGGSACAFSLTGTATLENGNQLRIPYSGSTCMGPISGTEVLKK